MFVHVPSLAEVVAALVVAALIMAWVTRRRR
jgi:uncharacterized protein (TIGR03382 family)